MMSDDFKIIGDELFLTPPNTKERISSIWAILSVDETGEGLCAAQIGGMMMTLTTAEERLVPILVSEAENLSTKLGLKLKLVKFTNREELQTIVETNR